MARDDLETLARLRGLLHVTRAVRDEEHLDDVLTRSRTRSRRRSATARSSSTFTGRPGRLRRGHRLRPRPRRRSRCWARARTRSRGSRCWTSASSDGGAYFVPRGEFDWTEDVIAHTPTFAPATTRGVASRGRAVRAAVGSDGSILGIICVDEPLSGRKPSEEEMQVLAPSPGTPRLPSRAPRRPRPSAPPSGPGGAAGRLVADHRVAGGGRDAGLDLRGHPPRARFRQGGRRPGRPLDGLLRPRHAVGWRADVLQAGAPVAAEDVHRCSTPSSRSGLLPAERGGGAGTATARPAGACVRAERRGPAGLEPALAAGAAVGPLRRAVRRDLGGRPRGPAAAVPRGDPGPARVREPDVGRAWSRPPTSRRCATWPSTIRSPGSATAAPSPGG